MVSTTAISISTINQGSDSAASKPPARMLNLLKKPLKGGTPVTASVATKKLPPTSGILLMTPFSEGSIFVPAA